MLHLNAAAHMRQCLDLLLIFAAFESIPLRIEALYLKHVNGVLLSQITIFSQTSWWEPGEGVGVG